MRIETDDLVTLRTAARLVGVSRTTVYSWLRDRKIDRIEIGGHPFVRGSQILRLRPASRHTWR